MATKIANYVGAVTPVPEPPDSEPYSWCVRVGFFCHHTGSVNYTRGMTCTSCCVHITGGHFKRSLRQVKFQTQKCTTDPLLDKNTLLKTVLTWKRSLYRRFRDMQTQKALISCRLGALCVIHNKNCYHLFGREELKVVDTVVSRLGNASVLRGPAGEITATGEFLAP